VPIGAFHCDARPAAITVPITSPSTSPARGGRSRRRIEAGSELQQTVARRSGGASDTHSTSSTRGEHRTGTCCDDGSVADTNDNETDPGALPPPVELIDPDTSQVTAIGTDIEVEVQSDSGPTSVLPRGVLILLALAGGFVVIFGMRQIAGIIAPIFTALCLTVTVYPVRSMLIRKNWPGWLATLVLVLATMGALLSLVVGMIWALARFVSILPQYTTDMQSTIDSFKSWISGLGITQDQVQNMLSKIDTGQLVSWLGSLLGNVISSATVLVFIIALILFMGVDGAAFPARMEKVRSARGPVLGALTSFAKGTRKYFAVATIFGGIVAILDTIAITLFGIPGAVLWGILAFITNYIPNIGFIIGLIPVAIMALLTGGVATMVGIIVVYCLLNAVIQSVLQPKFVGDSVGLTTTVSFLSLIIWAYVLGPLGAILAVPMTLLAKALLVDVDPNTRWLQLFLGDQPVFDKPKAERTGRRRFIIRSRPRSADS
jgi:predicted PurR-regulated permease PerM